MSSSFLEIIELDNGDYALQRAEGGDPLVTIAFSEEVKDFLGENTSAVVKAMVGAGVQATSAITKSMAEDDDEAVGQTLH